MASPGKRRGLVVGVLALAVAALCGALVAAGEIVRFTHNVPGDSKPIVLHADAMTTWLDGGRRIILLKGKVLVEHGVLQARMQQAVAWVDQEGYRKTGILRVLLYAEGNVTLESGPENRAGERALIDLNTRGEVKLKAHESKVNQQPQPNDPLFRRAQEVRASEVKTSSTRPIQQASFQEVAQTRPVLPPNQDLLPAQGPVGPPALGPPRSTLPSPAPNSTMTPVTPPAAADPSTPTPAPQPAPPTTAPSTGLPFPPTSSAPPGSTRTGPRSLLDGQAKNLTILSRTAAGFEPRSFLLANGEHVTVATGGVILLIRSVYNTPLLDIEADRLVFWTRGDPVKMLNNLRTPQGQTSRELEFYLAGNVEIRQQDKQETRTLRAEEVYYNVGRNVAVAMRADLEFKQPGLPDPVHLRAEELLQLSPTLFKGVKVEVYSSKLPSDPGLKLQAAEATLEDKQIPKRSIFGVQFINRQTGKPETEEERLFTGGNVFLRLEDIPLFYLPYVRGDANDPLGPLDSVNVNYNRVFGFQTFTTFNLYDLLGIDPYPGTRWKLYLDYMSRRGPALGSNFDYAEKSFFGAPAKVSGLVKAYGVYDTHTDELGGSNKLGLPRGSEDHHPDGRGRFLWRQNVQELPDGFSLQAQVAVLSDKNFLEQFFKTEFDNEINQETFVYLKQQQDNWAWTLLTEPRIRNWVTETEWLPRADGYLLGQSFFGIFSYNVHGSAGYARLLPTHRPPPPVEVTDQRDNTGRFDLMQELSAPFTLGPVRMVPYGVLDLTEYTEDLTGHERGRFYGGGGLRSSIPFTRLYPDIQSDLLNLNGINHKIVLYGNYYVAHADTPFTRLPQLDRLNDDATDQSLRDIKPREAEFDPRHGAFISRSPLFDPQLYAIRRLVDSRVDTLDTIEVFQGEIQQRLQTKRGFPGQQHIVDWMTLDLSGSLFPHPSRDNFGDSLAFLQYDWSWNIGDQTALYSNGWVDPIKDGIRVFSIGASFYRPDRTTITLGYREIDPLGSQAITSTFTYVFSPKYAMTAYVMYDFGTSSQYNSVSLTRIGSDLQMSLGFNYDSVFKSFGMNFEILPAILPPSKRIPGLAAFDPNTFKR